MTGDSAGVESATPIEPAHGRRVARGTIKLLSVQALALIAGFVIAAYLSRQLGPELYGLYTVAISIAIWVEVSATAMFSQTTLKFVAEAIDWQAVASTLAQAQLVTSLAAAILLAAAAPLLASWLGSPELAPYLRLFALEVPLFALAKVHRAMLIGRDAVGRGALLLAVYRLSQLALVLLLVGLGWSLAGAVLASIGASLARLLVARLFVRPALLRRPAFPLRRLLGYALPLFLYTIGMRFFNRLDLMVVKALAGPPAVAGYYGAAQNLTIVPFNMFSASFAALLLATLPRLWQRAERDGARTLIGQSMRLVWCFLPLAALVAGSAPEIVDLLFGGSYSPAAPLVVWLVFAAVALLMISTNTSILTATGRPGWTFVLTGPVVLLAFGGYLVLVPRFGAISAAIVTTTLAWLSACLSLLAVYRCCGVPPAPGTLVRAALMALVAYALSSLWRASGVWVIVELAVMTCVVIGGLFLLGELTGRDLAFVQSLLTRERSRPR